MQKELDLFKDTIWNTHPIRMQKDTCLPCVYPITFMNLRNSTTLKSVVSCLTLNSLTK